jgi:hypothetical protein
LRDQEIKFRADVKIVWLKLLFTREFKAGYLQNGIRKIYDCASDLKDQ